MNDSNCPYCSSKVLDKDITNHNYAQCAKCGVPHHFQCYCENDSHCGIYGCEGKTISTIPREITDLVVQEPKDLQTKKPTSKTLDELFERYTELTNDCNLDKNLLREHAINETYGKNTSALQKAYIDDYFTQRFNLDEDYNIRCGIGGIVIGGIIGGVIFQYLWGSHTYDMGVLGGVLGATFGLSIGFDYLGPWASSFSREERTKQLTVKYTKLIECAKEK